MPSSLRTGNKGTLSLMAVTACLAVHCGASRVDAQMLPSTETTPLENDRSEKVISSFRESYLGNATAQFELGVMYYFGNGMERSDPEAAFWLSKSANGGNIDAQELLGSMYFFGEGVPHDRVQAFVWWTVASGSGSLTAADKIGFVEEILSKSEIDRAIELTASISSMLPESDIEDDDSPEQAAPLDMLRELEGVPKTP